MRCRGIRGATTAAENSRGAILAATRELLETLVARNDVPVEEITSAFFTVTDDLDAEHPARAARQLGWDGVALLGRQVAPASVDRPRGSPYTHVMRNITRAYQLSYVYYWPSPSAGWAGQRRARSV